MSRKHKSYVPQVRKTKPIEAAQSSVEAEKEPVQSYEELNTLLGIPTTPEEADTWSSVGAYVYLRNNVMLGWPVYNSEDIDTHYGQYLSIGTAVSFMNFDELCVSEGYDLVENDAALREMTREQKFRFSSLMSRELVKMAEDSEGGVESALDNTSFTAVATAFLANQRVAAEAYSTVEDNIVALGEMTDEQVESVKVLSRFHYSNLHENPARVRRETAHVLAELRNPATRAFIESEIQRLEALAQEPEQQEVLTAPQADEIQEFPFLGQEVDFTILPAGTDVREYTEKLISDLSSKERESVDIKRVGVLETLREQLGADRTYYVHGVPNQDSETSVRKDYIGLVIQTHDRTGKVVGEDAIAVSPLERRNAGYLFRQDYSTHTSWRETLSQSKDVARANGARPLKFTEVEGRDKYDAYVDKALELLTCPPAKFSPDYELYFQKSSGEYVLRQKPLAKIGAKTLQAATYS